ncbi:putative aldehyde dehydrogenase [Actinoplanes missouriensis 431]|uniref:Putative aldehyde dehydrogenase n=1 Tax=Actinoplanes missouriensis (strain ATCC 14538 / DSM 43046 / CBS 188.64 / JCM 3121 / NBRC 102363 / NCIMB 12654 / NRRL B-3342 / UNCC 431) TaxID=512565 RepID=I0HDX5_ACTM4|nr:aldehyde dehydrogenase (NADP(+)) [Actinoplanes missouriensis]BAL91212.1 putative aldehyde dehydrogenase [Actinoplanes missouriensis 431]
MTNPLDGTDRARLLHAVADTLDAAADELVPLAAEETHLPIPRLTGELARTTFQLRLYADEITAGRVDDVREDPADPGWPTGPRPSLTRIRVPIGPVLIFAASNFPFAFSVAGTDTAAALAAGCPVVVKAHPGHPKLSRRVAALVSDVLPAGAFTLIEGEQAGRDALLDPRIRAAAFTGSLAGGRALFDLAASRPEPIPFYGELGSVNPAFVTRAAMESRGDEILRGFAGSYTLGLGQFCTKPGVLLVPAGLRAEQALTGILADVPGGMLLNERIAGGHRDARAELAAHPGVRVAVAGQADGTSAAPALLVTDTGTILDVLHEAFGPTAILVEYTSPEELLTLAARLPGQLTATVHAEPDEPITGPLLRELAGHAGRVILNGWPTGVSVSPAMHHGGPYPATTAPLHTSVGTAAIDRFLRPVTFQNVPDAARLFRVSPDSRVSRVSPDSGVSRVSPDSRVSRETA